MITIAYIYKNLRTSQHIVKIILVKIDRQSTAADIARTVAVQLGIEIQNPTLVEECPDNETLLDPLEYPMDRFLLWPQEQVKQTNKTLLKIC